MSVLPSLRQLQYLVVLSEHLNFSRAAEFCFVTQSTLSSGLKELEELLGTHLVERDRKKVLMTPIGLEVVRRARSILAATQDLSTLAASSGKAMTGPIRIGVIPTIAPFLLPDFLAVVRARYPKLLPALREDTTANLLARLEDGRLDLALIALPYESSNFLIEPLFEEELCIVGPKGDPELKQREIRLSPDISDHLLLLEEGHCLRDHTLYACGPALESSFKRPEATSLLTLLQMVESGLGIGLIPEMAVKTGLAKSPNLTIRYLKSPSPKRTIALAARRTIPRLDDFKVLAALLREIDAKGS